LNTILKHWRQVRRISQLELALEVGVSTRHLSFIETGKSRPSRDLIMKLSHSLALPLRERNAFLLASGYASQYPESSLESGNATVVNDLLIQTLNSHDPYPALVVNATA